jgi:beta-glucanase (GH16 family)
LARRCGTYHWQTTWPAKNCSYPVGHQSIHECTALPADWGSTFHEFAVEHTQEYLAFVVDSKVLVNVSKADKRAPLYWDMPFFLILNTAIGGAGTWAKPPNSDTQWPTYHRIDYIRSNSRA